MKTPKMSKLAAAYLDQFGYLAKIKAGDVTAAQAATLVERAEAVARKVVDEFENLRKNGGLKDWTAEFKRLREETPTLNWRVYSIEKQAEMIKRIANTSKPSTA